MYYLIRILAVGVLKPLYLVTLASEGVLTAVDAVDQRQSPTLFQHSDMHYSQGGIETWNVQGYQPTLLWTAISGGIYISKY